MSTFNSPVSAYSSIFSARPPSPSHSNLSSYSIAHSPNSSSSSIFSTKKPSTPSTIKKLTRKISTRGLLQKNAATPKPIMITTPSQKPRLVFLQTFSDKEILILRSSFRNNLRDQEVDFLFDDNIKKPRSRSLNSFLNQFRSIEECFNSNDFWAFIDDLMKDSLDREFHRDLPSIKTQKDFFKIIFNQALHHLDHDTILREVIGDELRKYMRVHTTEVYHLLTKYSVEELCSNYLSNLIRFLIEVFPQAFDLEFSFKMTWFKLFNHLNDVFISVLDEIPHSPLGSEFKFTEDEFIRNSIFSTSTKVEEDSCKAGGHSWDARSLDSIGSAFSDAEFNFLNLETTISNNTFNLDFSEF